MPHRATDLVPYVAACLMLLAYFQIVAILYRLAQFCAARLLATPVIKMTIGCGKRLGAFHLGEVSVEWRLVPVGCGLQFLGEPGNCDVTRQSIQDDPSLSPAKKIIVLHPARAWLNTSRTRRLLTILAGPLAGALAAFILWGQFVARESDFAPMPFTHFLSIAPGSPAEGSGFRKGDFVLFVRGTSASLTDGPDTVGPSEVLKPGSHVTALVFRRDGKDREPVYLTYNLENPLAQLEGAQLVTSELNALEFPIPRRFLKLSDLRYVSPDGNLRHGVRSYVLLSLDGFKALAEGRSEYQRYGALSFYTLLFTACFLLPIPRLDGTRLIRTLYEITLRSVPSQRMVTVIGSFAVMLLVAAGFFK